VRRRTRRQLKLPSPWPVAGVDEDAGDSVVKAVAVRYNANGSLDTGFDGGGIKVIGAASTTAVALQPDDGRIVVGYSDYGGAFHVARLLGSNGSLDTSFDTDGIADVTWTGFENVELNALVIQSDGKVAVAGQVTDSTTFAVSFTLARLTTAGAADNSFDTDGKLTTSFGGTGNDAYALRQQADGKLVAAGVNSGNFAIARYNSDGSLDTSFDTDGKLTTNLGGLDVAYGLWIGPDYAITAAGKKGNDFAAARYKVASSLEERRYAQTDANHNITSVADAFGDVKERFVYDPYGSYTVLSPTWTSTSENQSWSHFFQGKRYDAVVGAYDFDERILFPTLGRFGQADPLGYPDGSNR
jgi:uncharacterized delta-60 repeat protein/RHS repeat-associated protein